MPFSNTEGSIAGDRRGIKDETGVVYWEKGQKYERRKVHSDQLSNAGNVRDSGVSCMGTDRAGGVNRSVEGREVSREEFM